MTNEDNPVASGDTNNPDEAKRSAPREHPFTAHEKAKTNQGGPNVDEAKPAEAENKDTGGKDDNKPVGEADKTKQTLADKTKQTLADKLKNKDGTPPNKDAHKPKSLADAQKIIDDLRRKQSEGSAVVEYAFEKQHSDEDIAILNKLGKDVGLSQGHMDKLVPALESLLGEYNGNENDGSIDSDAEIKALTEAFGLGYQDVVNKTTNFWDKFASNNNALKDSILPLMRSAAGMGILNQIQKAIEGSAPQVSQTSASAENLLSSSAEIDQYIANSRNDYWNNVDAQNYVARSQTAIWNKTQKK